MASSVLKPHIYLYRMKTLILSLTCFCLAFGATNAFADDDRGLVTHVTGNVQFATPGSAQFSPLQKGDYLEIGSTIRSGADGNAVIALIPGSAINIEPDTVVVLKTMQPDTDVAAPRVLVSLRSGTISALIDKNQEVRPDFKIETPQGTAAARGTFYAVAVVGNTTYAAVKEGQVAVQSFR
jgi:hypothetical protein